MFSQYKSRDRTVRYVIHTRKSNKNDIHVRYERIMLMEIHVRYYHLLLVYSRHTFICFGTIFKLLRRVWQFNYFIIVAF